MIDAVLQSRDVGEIKLPHSLFQSIEGHRDVLVACPLLQTEGMQGLEAIHLDGSLRAPE